MTMQKLFNAKFRILALAGVLALLSVIVTPLLLGGEASAVSNGEPKAPFSWADNDHNKLTDANNNEYFPLGYACLRSAVLTNKDATSIDKAAATTGQTDANKITETDPNSVKVRVGKCDNKVQVASYVWVTKSAPYYAFLVNTYADKKYDTRFCPIRDNDCSSFAYKLKDGAPQGAMIVGNTVVAAPGATGPPSTPTVPGPEEVKLSPTCEKSGFSLAWIACPMINNLAATIDGMYAVIIKPLLVTKPIDTSSSAKCIGETETNNSPDNYRGCNYQVWSNFRVYGNIILIIALLVIVFGQSIGGGLVDAYTAKKILPRLLAASILINLSIYIVAFLVDLTNILGGGIQTLLSQPFQNADSFKLTLNGGSATVVTGLGVTALLGTGGAIWATIASTSALGLAIAPLLPALVGFLALFVLLPAVLIFVAILATVLIRNGLIIFLILSAPVAFALYCLPNTEKYFKKWWELLWKTLLVYPIIAFVFSIADILAVTISQGGSANGPLAFVAQLLSIVALIIPLFLIPFAFKLAGGLLGQIYETSNKMRLKGQEAIKGNANLPNSLRNRVKGNVTGRLGEAGAQSYRQLESYHTASKGGGGRPTLRGRVAGRLAGPLAGTIESEALRNAAAKQRIENIKNNGDDSIVNARASFVDPVDKKRKTLDGKEVSDIDWRSSKRLYPTLSDAQAVADYRSTKVLTTPQAEQFERNFGLMSQQMGLTDEQTTGMFTSLSFARQNERNEWKHGKWSTGSDGKRKFLRVGKENMDGAKRMVNEQYNRKGSYDASRAHASQFIALGNIKKAHLEQMDRASADYYDPSKNDTQRASALAINQESREEVRKLVEIENAWEQNAGGYDDKGQPIKGLAGASPATIAAFEEMKKAGSKNGVEHREVSSVRADIAKGNTWEKLNNEKGSTP